MQIRRDKPEIMSKIGQIFMGGMPGLTVDSGTEILIRDYHLGGIVLFSRNITGPQQVAQLCSDLQGLALRHNRPPLFLAVDQEGGRVARLKAPFTEFPGNEAIGSDPQPQKKAIEFSTITAEEMKRVGLNMNFAPVLDIGRGGYRQTS